MKFKSTLYTLSALLVIGLSANSCKKSNQDYLQTLLTGGQWQLTALQVTYYTGANIDSTVQKNTTCNLFQIFKFNTDNTCSYTNYDCITQAPVGHWQFQSGELYLSSDITCQDTTAAKKSQPFLTSKIINLGSNLLILQTGDLQIYFTPTQKRKITQYTFARQKDQ